MGAAEPELDAATVLGALAEPSRRRLYEFVVASGRLVSRDEAAEATGLERATAAHHLDRLASDGLLDFEFRRTSGRAGPGAGRPAKLYRRSEREFDLSLPPRDYELAGRLLAEAADLSRTNGMTITDALDAAATDEGIRFAAELRSAVEASETADRTEVMLAGLSAHGFEPQTLDDGTIVLTNCPFHHLAELHTDLICGMNFCILTAASEAFEGTEFDAALEPSPDVCCVRFIPVRSQTGQRRSGLDGEP